MLTSGTIDLVIGLTFVFGVTAALASLVTEMIARLIGLRGAYLLSGLRELVDGGEAPTDLTNVAADYQAMKDMIRSRAISPADQAAGDQAAGDQAAGDQAAGDQAAGDQTAGDQTAGDQTAGQATERKPSATAALLGSPILVNQGIPGQFTSRKLQLAATRGTGRLPKMTAVRTSKIPWPNFGRLWKLCRSLPSYISARSFAEAVVDLVIPNADDRTTMNNLEDNINALPAGMPFKSSLQGLVKNTEGDITKFRDSVEQWYDDHMDRVSGWYKRHVAKITLAIGAIIVVLLNINALTIGRTLYTESAVSTAISSVAAKATNCPTASPSPASTAAATSESDQQCLEDLQAQLTAAASAGLPIGWGTVRDCTPPGAACNWLDQRGILSRHGDSGWQLVLVIIGFVIMIIALLPGAQFWFGLLSTIGGLRASGPKPKTAGS